MLFFNGLEKKKEIGFKTKKIWKIWGYIKTNACWRVTGYQVLKSCT